jgi:hypothetical protein
MKIDCIVSDYISKSKTVQMTVTIFHSHESRLKKQTTNIRRGSNLFFSGEMTLVEGKTYVELHNISFLTTYGTQAPTTTAPLPWATSESTSFSTPQNNAYLIHQEPATPESAKRKLQKPFQPNKTTKLADICNNALADKKNDSENDDNGQNNDNQNDNDDAQNNDIQSDDGQNNNENFSDQPENNTKTVAISQFYL